MNDEVRKVSNNMEKNSTYRDLMERYKRAAENDFYYEALFILYAVMEDKLRSILYHSAVTKERESKYIDNPTCSSYLLNMFYKYNNNIDKKTHNLDFNKIFDKISMVRALLRWERQNTDYISNDYLKKLKEQYKIIDKEEYLTLLNEVQKWTKYRNSLIHSILENNIDSINNTLKAKVDEGYRLVLALQNLTRLVKKHSFVLAQ